MTIAILAHDSRKELALQFCTAYSAILSKNTVIATGTTGRMLAQATGLQRFKTLQDGKVHIIKEGKAYFSLLLAFMRCSWFRICLRMRRFSGRCV